MGKPPSLMDRKKLKSGKERCRPRNIFLPSPLSSPPSPPPPIPSRLPCGSPPPYPYFRDLPPDLNIDEKNNDDDNDDFFDARPDNAGAVAAAVTDFGEAVATKPEKIVVSDNLNRLFLKTEQIFNEPEPVKNEISTSNYESKIKEINKGEIPIELDFFVGAGFG